MLNVISIQVFSIQLNEIDIRKGENRGYNIYYKIFSTHFRTQIKLLNTEYLNTLPISLLCQASHVKLPSCAASAKESARKAKT